MIAATESTADLMERRLLAWAAWRTRGGSGDGYPTRSVLDPSWLPPARGSTPAMRGATVSSDAEERRLDHLIDELSVRLRDALYVVYIKRFSPADQARHLSCQEGTVRSRILEAKRQLGGAVRRGFTS